MSASPTVSEWFFGGEGRRGPVVGHFIHEGVAHCRGCFVVDAILSLGGEVVFFFDFVGPDTLCDADHPKELELAEGKMEGADFVDIVAGVA